MKQHHFFKTSFSFKCPTSKYDIDIVQTFVTKHLNSHLAIHETSCNANPLGFEIRNSHHGWKSFKVYHQRWKGPKEKDHFFDHLVECLYSLNLEFVAPNVSHMYKK